MDKALLEIRDLRTWMDGGDTVVRAVEGLSLSVREGETFALVGESGCGKSMTALSVMRLLPETGFIAGGAIRFAGESLLSKPEMEMRGLRGRRIAMIFQEPMLSLNPVMTAGEQIAETLRRHAALAGGALKARVIELLEAVGIPDPQRRADEYPFQLSGGMKQRVMIALALACDPELLIADEPTTALDVTIQAQILELLREAQRSRRMGLLLITHDLGIVSEMAHRVAVMYAGEVVEVAERDAFFQERRHPYSRKLFASLPTQRKRGARLDVIRGSVPPLTAAFRGCRFAERCDFAFERCRAEAPAWHELPGGGGVRCHLYDADAGAQFRTQSAECRAQSADSPSGSSVSEKAGDSLNAQRSTSDGAPLLEVRNLAVHFPIRRGVLQRVVGHVRAVDGVSLAIRRGTTLGLVGESGCGKTTVGKGILRLIDPTAGEVTFSGRDLLRLSRGEMRTQRRHAQIIFQDPYASLNPRMRIAETIEEGMLAQGLAEDAPARQARIDRLLAEVGLAPDVKLRYPHEFSGGQRQRIAIARALAVEPQLIVCDEPTSALDVSVQAQILNLLKELQARKGIAYLFISHNISVIEFLADEVAVMYLGRIVEHGAVREVLEDPQHPYTQALLSAVPMIERGSKREVIRLEGDIPSPANPPAGCHFHPRCPAAMARCREAYPAASAFSATHSAHCHLYPVDY